MVTGEIGASNKLYQLIEQYRDDPCCLDILRFWAGHSSMRFNRKALINAFYTKRSHVERALKRLVDDGMVRTNFENNDPIYSLGEDGSVRSLVSELVGFDWGQWRSITGKIYPACATTIFRIGPICEATSKSGN
jgi:hypothetical protein